MVYTYICIFTSCLLCVPTYIFHTCWGSCVLCAYTCESVYIHSNTACWVCIHACNIRCLSWWFEMDQVIRVLYTYTYMNLYTYTHIYGYMCIDTSIIRCIHPWYDAHMRASEATRIFTHLRIHLYIADPRVVNESCHTYMWVMSHTSTAHFPPIRSVMPGTHVLCVYTHPHIHNTHKDRKPFLLKICDLIISHARVMQ